MQSYAQSPTLDGDYSKYVEQQIFKIEEFTYNNNLKYTLDTSLSHVLYINEKGQLTKETFYRGKWGSDYKYEYNDEGFLVDIDTNGMFVYGYSSSIAIIDTTYNYSEITETWMDIDTFHLLKMKIEYFPKDSLAVKSTFEYDSVGRILEKQYFSKNSNEEFQFFGCDYYEYNNLGLPRFFKQEDIDGYNYFQLYIYHQLVPK